MPPTRLFGFSSDLDSGRLTKAVEEKVTDHKLTSEKDLLEKAIDVAERNKDIFF